MHKSIIHEKSLLANGSQYHKPRQVIITAPDTPVQKKLVVALSFMDAYLVNKPYKANIDAEAIARRAYGEKILIEKKDHPTFKAGDTITVFYKIKEGEKERIQFFKGDVIQRKGSGLTETFTIRKISNGIGVERVFPINSPGIEKIEINKLGKVRRARIFYMRERTGKSARIKQKRV